MTNTNYGIKKKGASRFIIVAPHAAGDDLRTGKIAEIIAKQLGAFLVVNKKYVKPTNSKAGIKPVKDFNKLSIRNEKYVWGNSIASQHMKEFYDDIQEFVNCAHKFNKNAVVVYIHGMRNGKDKIGIDIGCGLKYHDNKLKTAKIHPEAGTNTGVRRAKRNHMERLKKILGERLNKYGLKAGIGEAKRGKKKFAAWDRRNAVQLHAGSKNYSFQLEIARSLRNKGKLKNTSEIIAKALKEIY
ncbi:hypothetical protein KJA13_01460 [Patescibacteria group bacterium]|nr:hypothetical protein [Patescibacteria group bacterium]